MKRQAFYLNSKRARRPLGTLGALALVVSGFALSMCAQAQVKTGAAQERETVLDRKAHISPEWVLDIPEVPRLCDVLKLKKHRIPVGPGDIYCDEEGQGMPIVLINGGPGATHHYFHPWFSKAAGFARVIYYDQRGTGLSDYKPGPEGYSVAQGCDDLEKIRKALDVEDWVVIGHSYGGYLAQQYAVRYPDHLAGLILVGAADAIGISLGTRQYDFMTPEERKTIQAAQQAPGLSDLQRLYNAHLMGDWKRQNFYRPTEEDLARMVRYEWVHDPVFRSQIGRTMSKDLAGYFDTFPVPTMIMEGKWDLTWTADKPEKMQAAFPRAKVLVFERSSHNPFQDEPDRFFGELKAFIGGLGKPSPDALASWRKDIDKILQSPIAIVQKYNSGPYGGGAAASKKIAQEYKKEWLAQINPKVHSSQAILRLGWALYDEKRYEDALDVFRLSDGLLVWQGFMLDLLGRRDEAIQAYQKAIDTKNVWNTRHDNYGIVMNEEYVKKHLEQPFTRAENRWDEIVNAQMEEEQRFHQTPLYITLNRALASASPYGQEASRSIVKEYKKEWLTQLSPRDSQTSMRLAFALYDEKLYEDALAVFQRMPMMKMWEGFVLDLLGRRDEAIECYKAAIAVPRRGPKGNTYGQYGITDSVEYIKQYLEKPFVRIENSIN